MTCLNATAPLGAADVDSRFKSNSPSVRDWVLLGLLAALPAILPVFQIGYLHPDENFQYLEPAFRKVYGYGLVAWEWRQGLRNWFAPMVLAGMLKICAWLNITDFTARRAAIAVPFFLLQWLMLVAVYRFTARVSGKGRIAGGIAALSIGLMASVLLFAGRPLAETISTALLVMAIEAITRNRDSAQDAAWAGVELGLAVVTRYGSIPMVLVILLWLLVRRQWKALRWCMGGGIVIAAGLGVMDWISWGWPFASMWNYIHFNVLSGGSARLFGDDPAQYYLRPIVLMTPLWAWVLLPIALRRAPDRSPLWLLLLCSGVYLAVIFRTEHKEKRFLYPALVLLTLAASVGWPVLIDMLGRRRFAVVLLIGLVVAVAPMFARPPFKGDFFRAIVDSAKDPETTGIAVIGEEPWESAGYFYVMRAIPLRHEQFATPQRLIEVAADREINRVVVTEKFIDAPELQGFRQIRRMSQHALLARDRDRSITPSGPTEYSAEAWEANTMNPGSNSPTTHD